jgi:hypothetical protein
MFGANFFGLIIAQNSYECQNYATLFSKICVVHVINDRRVDEKACDYVSRQ